LHVQGPNQAVQAGSEEKFSPTGYFLSNKGINKEKPIVYD
jgi:hypothetical protein